MKEMLKKYVPYAAILAAIYLLLPLMFSPGEQAKTNIDNYSPIVYHFIFPAAAVVCAVHYSWKNGLDFLFAVIAPAMYLPSMLLFNMDQIVPNGIILMIIYLVCGILGSFIGDMVYCEEKKKREKEKKKAIAISVEKESREKEQEQEDFYSNYSYSPLNDEDITEDEIDKILNETKRKDL